MAWPPQPSPPRHSPNVAGSRDGMDNETGTESLVSHRRERARRRNREEGNEAMPLTSLGPPWAPQAPPGPPSSGGPLAEFQIQIPWTLVTPQQPCSHPASSQVKECLRLQGPPMTSRGSHGQPPSLLSPQQPGPMGTQEETGGGNWGCPLTVRPLC